MKLPVPEIPVSEVMRYAGCQALDEQTKTQMHQMIQLAKSEADCMYVMTHLSIEDEIIVQMMKESASIRHLLQTCDEVIFIAATLGVKMDRAIARMQKLDMGNALWLNASANALIESVMDTVYAQLETYYESQQRYLSDRFSCGYGDLKLEWQKTFLDCTQASKKLGLMLGESLLMRPEKSVTALIGISDQVQGAMIRGCRFCRLNGNCGFQKGGTTCGK